MAARARVGISGWRYPPWRGTFYPKDLPQRRELEFAARHVDTLEINGTFYALQKPDSFITWRETAPAGFVFTVKGGRFITHMRRLRQAREPLANFFASGLLALEGSLGPILWQLPRNFTFEEDVLSEFLALLPTSTAEAARLARRHGSTVTGRAWMHPSEDRPLRHALEVRHSSFNVPEFYELLRRHNVALVASHSSGAWPFLTEITADFTYARLHGSGELYAGGYPDAELDEWARRARGWTDGTGCPDGRTRNAFIFFDNDAKVRAPFDAQALASRLRDSEGDRSERSRSGREGAERDRSEHDAPGHE